MRVDVEQDNGGQVQLDWSSKISNFNSNFSSRPRGAGSGSQASLLLLLGLKDSVELSISSRTEQARLGQDRTGQDRAGGWF